MPAMPWYRKPGFYMRPALAFNGFMKRHDHEAYLFDYLFFYNETSIPTRSNQTLRQEKLSLSFSIYIYSWLEKFLPKHNFFSHKYHVSIKAQSIIQITLFLFLLLLFLMNSKNSSVLKILKWGDNCQNLFLKNCLKTIQKIFLKKW